jgi:hypothetical protein
LGFVLVVWKAWKRIHFYNFDKQELEEKMKWSFSRGRELKRMLYTLHFSYPILSICFALSFSKP